MKLLDARNGKQLWHVLLNKKYQRNMPVFFWQHFCGYMHSAATGATSGIYWLILLHKNSGKEMHRLTCWRYAGSQSLSNRCFSPKVRAVGKILAAFPSPKNNYVCKIEGGMSIFCLRVSTFNPLPVLQHANIYIEIYLGMLIAAGSTSNLEPESSLISDSIVNSLARESQFGHTQLRVTEYSTSNVLCSTALLGKVKFNLIQPHSQNHTLIISVDLEKVFNLKEPCRTFAAINIPQCYKQLNDLNDRSAWPYWFEDGQQRLTCGVLERLTKHPYTCRLNTFSPSLEIQELGESERRLDLLSGQAIPQVPVLLPVVFKEKPKSFGCKPFSFLWTFMQQFWDFARRIKRSLNYMMIWRHFWHPISFISV